jgi:hypothetical protein
MNKTMVSVLLVVVLIIGLLLGYVGTSVIGPPKAGEVHNAPLRVGDRAPDFRLRDHTGRTIKLGDYAGKKNVVLAFLPGAFTPI